jgi:hypothetical protein
MTTLLDLDAIRAKYAHSACDSCHGARYVPYLGIGSLSAASPCRICNGTGLALPLDIASLLVECERLRAEVASLQRLTSGLADRVAGQSEILTRLAEKPEEQKPC